MDVWRMGILRPDGGRQRIDYSAITQPWLREAAKQWNLQRLVSRNVGTLRETVHVAAALSAVLRLREDRGDEPRALGRQDAVDFLMHLRARELWRRAHKLAPPRARLWREGAAARGARAGAASAGWAA